jgi:hypothetical protein
VNRVAIRLLAHVGELRKCVYFSLRTCAGAQTLASGTSTSLASAMAFVSLHPDVAATITALVGNQLSDGLPNLPTMVMDLGSNACRRPPKSSSTVRQVQIVRQISTRLAGCRWFHSAPVRPLGRGRRRQTFAHKTGRDRPRAPAAPGPRSGAGVGRTCRSPAATSRQRASRDGTIADCHRRSAYAAGRY